VTDWDLEEINTGKIGEHSVTPTDHSGHFVYVILAILFMSSVLMMILTESFCPNSASN
jgi:hypothetical protein